MGICASCLGRARRHPSPHQDENDRLLDDSQVIGYGAIEAEDAAQPDEEELRREREALERVAAQAQDDMIDSHGPHASEISHYLASPKQHCEPEGEDIEAQEAAWLDAIKNATANGDVVRAAPLALVMDVGELRDVESAGEKKATKR